MQIMEIDDRLLGKLPNLFELIYKVYGLKEVDIFAFHDGGMSGFICNDGEVCLYSDKQNHKLFKVDEDYNLISYHGDKYVVYYDDSTTFKDTEGNEYKLDLVRSNDEDDEVNGKLCYTAYYPVSDILCQFNYPHVYREVEGKARLYSVDSRDYESIYIEEEFSKHEFKRGFLPKRIKAFNKVSFDYDMIGYGLVRFNEKGLSYLLNGEDELEPKIDRFVKSYYIGKNGYYRDFGILGRLYKPEEIEDLIKSYGISSGIDSEMIKLYNKDDYLIHRIQTVLNELKNTKDREDLGISLSLKEK